MAMKERDPQSDNAFETGKSGSSHDEAIPHSGRIRLSLVRVAWRRCPSEFRARVWKGAILCGSIAVLLGFGAHAANQTWDGGSSTDGFFSDLANWIGNVAPGATGGSTTSTDVAIFNAPIVNTWGNSAVDPVVIDSGTQNIGGINFDTAADNYFIGSTGGNPLLVSSGGAIQILSTLTATNAVETINAPLQIQGAGGAYTVANNSQSGSGAGAGTLNIGGGITGTGGGATVLTLSGSNTSANKISGVIANGTATTLGVTKSGSGAWTLTGANTYTGPTTVNGGTLTVDATNGPATLAATAVTFGGGALVFKGDAIGTSFTLGNVTLAAGGVGSSLQLVGGAAGTVLALGSVPTAPAYTVSLNFTASLNIAVSGANSSVTTTTQASAWTNGTGLPAAYTFTSGGVTSFATLTTNNANNAFSGLVITTPLPSTTVTEPTVNCIVTGSLTEPNVHVQINALQINATTGNTTLTLSGSTIRIDGMGLLITGSSQVTINGTGAIEVFSDGTLSLDTSLMIHNFGTGGLILDTTLEITGTGLSNTGPPVVIDGPGKTTFAANATGTSFYVGGGGVVNLNALNLFNNAAPVTLNNATLQIAATGTGRSAITLNDGGGTFDTQAFTMTETGLFSGVGSLTKIGSGTLTLSHANTYTGATTVTAGTLLVSGVISGSTSTISGAGTLGGSGGTTGAVIVNSGGTLAPGTSASTGVLYTGPVTLNGTAAFHLTLNTSASTASQVFVTGGLTLAAGNTTTLSLADLGANVALTPGTVFPIIDYSGNWNGGLFSGLANDSAFTFGANQFEIAYNGRDTSVGGINAVTLTVLAVPEPDSAVFLGIGALALAACRPRKARGGVN